MKVDGGGGSYWVEDPSKQLEQPLDDHPGFVPLQPYVAPVVKGWSPDGGVEKVDDQVLADRISGFGGGPPLQSPEHQPQTRCSCM